MDETTVDRAAAIRRGYALGLVGVIIFSLSLPGTRLAVPELGAELVTAGRAALAGLLSLAYLLVGRRRLPARRHWRDLGLVIGGVVIGFPLCTALAMREVEASHGGVVLSLMPLMTAGTGALFAGERPSLRFWLAALAGTAVVLAFMLYRAGGFSQADLYLALAGLGASIGYAGGARMTAHMPALEAISWSLALALPVSLPLMLFLWPADPAAASLVAWGALGFVAAFPQFIGFFFWYGGLAAGGIARVGQMQLLQVYFTLGFSALLLGERVDLVTWVAAVLTVFCVWLGRKAPVRSRAEGAAHLSHPDASGRD
ncbi:MAG TPA: DMT family transporter [Geminicoccaceae bacterium]|nr:DMT family transporter [Geminicoccaceae bacterium]HRY26995.1 DMT family transporter [Geminicoccaceae bacterium]